MNNGTELVRDIVNKSANHADIDIDQQECVAIEMKERGLRPFSNVSLFNDCCEVAEALAQARSVGLRHLDIGILKKRGLYPLISDMIKEGK